MSLPANSETSKQEKPTIEFALISSAMMQGTNHEDTWALQVPGYPSPLVVCKIQKTKDQIYD